MFQKMELLLEDIHASGTKSAWKGQSCGLYLGCRQAEQRPVCSLVLQYLSAKRSLPREGGQEHGLSPSGGARSHRRSFVTPLSQIPFPLPSCWEHCAYLQKLLYSFPVIGWELAPEGRPGSQSLRDGTEQTKELDWQAYWSSPFKGWRAYNQKHRVYLHLQARSWKTSLSWKV